MSKHTPGPWEIEKAEFEEYWKPDVHYNAGPACAITKEADARLIAAAPDLLEALQSVVEFWDKLNFDGSAINNLHVAGRAAIAKATWGAA